MRKKWFLGLALLVVSLSAGIGLTALAGDGVPAAVTVKPVAWYQFADAERLGKDTMGNFDLAVYRHGDQSTGPVQADDGGACVDFTTANPGALLAEPLSSGKEFSELLGSFTISLYAKMTTQDPVQRYLLSTGAYGQGFLLYYGPDTYVTSFHAGAPAGAVLADMASGWTHLAVTYDRGERTLRLYADAVAGDVLTDVDISLADADGYVFTLGGQSKFGGEAFDIARDFRMADVKIYNTALSSEAVAQLAAARGAEVTAPFAGKTTAEIPEITLSAPADSTDAELAELLPATVKVTASDGTRVDASVFWPETPIFDRSEDNCAKLGGGVVFADDLVNNAGLRASVRFAFASDVRKTNIQPLAWYRFTDAAALGRDSEQNFDLTSFGTLEATAGPGGRAGVAFPVTADAVARPHGALYAPRIDGTKDFADRLKSFTLAFWYRIDDATPRHAIVSTSHYGSNFDLMRNGDGGRILYLSYRGIGNTDLPLAEIPLTDGQMAGEWMHIALTYDAVGESVRMFVNGKQAVAANRAGTVTLQDASDYSFTLGNVIYGDPNDLRYDPNAGCGMSLADFRVYDAALNASAVAAVMADEDGTADILLPLADFAARVSFDAPGAEAVTVSAQNTEAAILASLPKRGTVISDLGETDSAAVIAWKFVDQAGVAHGVVYASVYANVSGLEVTQKLRYPMSFEIGDGGAVIVDNVTYRTGETLIAEKGTEVRLTVRPPEHYAIQAVRYGGRDLTAAEGAYSFVFDGSTLTVSFERTTTECTLTFDTKGGSAVAAVTVEQGATLASAGVVPPVREGYLFAGWYEDEALRIPFGNATPIVEDLTLYAKWETKPADDGQGEGDGKGGCGGAALGSPAALGGLLLIGVSLPLWYKKRSLRYKKSVQRTKK